jgi:hypothetical protein
MKENKFPTNIFLKKKGSYLRNKSKKLLEIKNLYTTSLNKSINCNLRTNLNTECAVKVKPLETESTVSNLKLNFSKEEKKVVTKFPNKELLSKNLDKNNFINYLSNTRKYRNSSAIYKNKSNIHI